MKIHRSYEANFENYPLSWLNEASCTKPGVDPNIFFASRGEVTKLAKKICKRCVVREQCLDNALKTFDTFSGEEDEGIIGGTSPRERKILRSNIQNNNKQ